MSLLGRLKRRERDARAEWAEHDRLLGERGSWDVYESYPSGSGDTTLAERIADTGMLYACNLALHGAGFALAVQRTPGNDDEAEAARKARDEYGPLVRATGRVEGLVLQVVLDPEGASFDELGHRESLDKMTDELVVVLAHRFGEAHARLAREAERRARRK